MSRDIIDIDRGLELAADQNNRKITSRRLVAAASALAVAGIGGNAMTAEAESPSVSYEMGGFAVECAFPNPITGGCNDHLLGDDTIPDHGDTAPRGGGGGNSSGGGGGSSSGGGSGGNSGGSSGGSSSGGGNSSGGGGGSSSGGGNSSSGGNRNSSGGSSSGGNTYVAPQPQTFEQRTANSSFAEDCADPTPYAWTEGSLMFENPAPQAAGIANESAEAAAPSQQIQIVTEALAANRGEDGGSWINKVIEQCELRPLTGQEFIDWFGEEAAPAYDQHRRDFGYPVTNWEVIMAEHGVFNVDVSAAQQNLVIEFQGELVDNLEANVPNLNWDAYAAGQMNLDGTPVEG